MRNLNKIFSIVIFTIFITSIISFSGCFEIEVDDENSNINITNSNDSSIVQNEGKTPNFDTIEIDLGNCTYGDTKTITFRITNNQGIGLLQLTGNPVVKIEKAEFNNETDPVPFTLTQSPSSEIDNDGSTEFKITYSPTSTFTGTQKAQITIYSNDPEVEVYSFTLQGTGVSGKDIYLSTDGVEAIGTVDFGDANVSTGYVEKIFVIDNQSTYNHFGINTLNVSSVAISSGDFVIITGPTYPIALDKDATSSFTIRFDPTVAGERTATLIINSDDPDEAPYTVTLSGNGI